MTKLTDNAHMRRALELAREAGEGGEVPIGCVIVSAAGERLGEAANAPIATHDPTAHAEIVALRQAAAKLQNYRLSGATLYVTVEPCAMCASAISQARIARLVYGAPSPKFGGVDHGARIFAQPTTHHRPDVTSGVLADECAALMQLFFQDRRS